MKKFYLLLFALVFFIGCNEHNTPTPPDDDLADTTTYVCDTMNYMFAAAYTWDLHAYVIPHIFYIVNEKDTFLYEFASVVDTLTQENLEKIYEKIVEKGKQPEDVGVRFCEFQRIVKWPAYLPFRIDFIWGYTFSKSPEGKSIKVGGYEYDKSWKEGHNGSARGSSGMSFEEISDNELVEYLSGNTPAPYFYFNGTKYCKGSGKSSTIYNQ